MKQENHFIKKKRAAILLAVLCGAAAFAGTLASAYTDAMQLYQKPLQTVIESHHKDLQKYYSIKIIDCRENGKLLPNLANMEYGILKTFDGMLQTSDIEEQGNYVYSNFHDTNPSDTSYSMQYVSGSSQEYTVGYPTLLSSLYGNSRLSLGFMPDFNTMNSHRDYIERIVYNEDENFLYFEVASGHYFPIYHVSAPSAYTTAAPNIPRNQLIEHESFTFNKQSGEYESDSGNCTPLQVSAYKKWNHLHFEGGQFYTKMITTVNTEDMGLPAEHTEQVKLVTKFSEDPEKKAMKSYPYIYYETPDITAEQSYWVISNVKKEIDTSASDLFAKQAVFLTNLYQYRYLFVGSIFFWGAGFILALCYLFYITKAAQEDSISAIRKWHKIPLLLYLGVMIMLIAGSIWILAYYTLRPALTGTMSARTACFPAAFLTLFSVLLMVLLSVNLIERYCGHILWKYSVTGYLACHVKKATALFREHTGLMVKGGIVFAAVCLIELFCMFCTLLMANGDADMLFGDWILFKIIALPVFLAILLQMKHLQTGSRRLAEGNLRSKLDTSKMLWEFKKHGDYLNQIGDGMSIALEERLRSERFKTELITNVSHDIKTPLTSIINYIDLLQKKDTAPEERKEYLEVLERQSARLKKLIEDLIEASKASSGTLSVNLEDCDIDILLTQTAGEYEEKLADNQLELIIQKKDLPVHIQADNRHLWRIFDNLMNNICKYSQSGTRVYINQKIEPEQVRIFFLNTSKYALNISGDELMERFVRGDTSRTTEGNGLGLSIARSLTELMNGTLQISVEGDLFKVILSFPLETGQTLLNQPKQTKNE